VDFYFIGEAELATAFRFVGVAGAAVSDLREAREAFARATSGGIEIEGAVLPDASRGPTARVLIITEEIADALGRELAEWQLSGRYPLVVELPGLQGRQPGRKTLVDAIRDAIGIRV